MTTERRRTSAVIATVGAIVVTAYAVLAAVQIMVLTPLAAVPGLSLGQIRAEMGAAGESPADAVVLIVLGLGIAIAVASAVILVRVDVPSRLVALIFLVILMFGGPAFFVASFAPGMSLGDTFMISGGVTLPGVAPFYIVSGLAGLACTALAVTWVVQSGSSDAGTTAVPSEA